jgi:hypothetical protein
MRDPFPAGKRPAKLLQQPPTRRVVRQVPRKLPPQRGGGRPGR